MKVLGNSNCILHIISNMLKMQNAKLLDHGSRVGYLVAKMLEAKGLSEREILEGYLIGLLHDVGAYKTEEIDKLIQFETKNVCEHSIYGYLILELSEIMGDMADVILYHHTPWNKINGISADKKEMANLIFLADRVEIYVRSKQEPIDMEMLKKHQFYSEENLELFVDADQKYDLQKRLMDGSFINDTEKYLYRAEFSEEELKKWIRMVAFLIDFRSESTVTHTITMVSASVAIANKMGLSKQQIDEIYTGAYIHDLGKIAIPVDILEKPGKLTFDEMEVMKTHILLTGNIIRGHVNDNVYKIAMRHHEKINGKGYPYGIEDEEMTLAEKIVAVADIYSALSGTRSYKEKFEKEKIISIMEQMAEQSQNDSEVIRVLVDNYDEITNYVEQECAEILNNYLRLKERYLKLHEIFSICA